MKGSHSQYTKYRLEELVGIENVIKYRRLATALDFFTINVEFQVKHAALNGREQSQQCDLQKYVEGAVVERWNSDLEHDVNKTCVLFMVGGVTRRPQERSYCPKYEEY